MEGLILFCWVTPSSGRKSQRLSSKTFGWEANSVLFCQQVKQKKTKRVQRLEKGTRFCIRDIMEREGTINPAKVFHGFYWIPAKVNRLIPERNLEKIPS